jgi:RNA polymerase sigma-54 factor
MLNQRLSQKQTQKLSPQQIQLMKLLQVPTLSLELRIKQELEENPALEEVRVDDAQATQVSLDNTDSNSPDNNDDQDNEGFDEYDMSGYIDDDDGTPGYKLHDPNYGSSEENKSIPRAMDVTFHEYLMEQLGMVSLKDQAYIAARQIIGSIDEDGYLRRSLDSISDDLAFKQSTIIEVAELEYMLHIIQSFDPPGVGARSLQECLIIQLRRRHPEENHYVKLAITILENHFEEFTKKHYDKLCRQLHINDEDLKCAVDEILKLNPKPGNAYSSNSSTINPETYIVPDFIVSNINDELVLTLNSRNTPELRISDTYREMLREYSRSKNKKKDHQQNETILFIKQKIDSAKWFIDAIKQRQATMLKTMEAILSYQHDYFITGDEMQLRPMILKDVADITGLDISTISRVSNSKFVQTEFGTFSLKSFFSEAMQTDSGEEVSNREIKKILTDLIGNESKKRPLSDQKITEELVKRGYNIARRTVAKYREHLDIPVARLRKKL